MIQQDSCFCAGFAIDTELIRLYVARPTSLVPDEWCYTQIPNLNHISFRIHPMLWTYRFNHLKASLLTFSQSRKIWTLAYRPYTSKITPNGVHALSGFRVWMCSLKLAKSIYHTHAAAEFIQLTYIVYINEIVPTTQVCSTETDQNRKCTRLNKPKNILPRKSSFLLVLASVPWWFFLG